MIEVIENELSTANFWLTVIQDSVSGITIGLTISLIGYFIWKKQNLYSKKFEVYINVISATEEIYSVTSHSITRKGVPMLDKFYELDETLFKDLKKNKILFRSFFGEKYNDKIEYFININQHMERVQITVKNGDLSTTRLYKPEEQTPQIVNHHKQDVIFQMYTYLKELKLASKNLEGYALIKKKGSKKKEKELKQLYDI